MTLQAPPDVARLAPQIDGRPNVRTLRLHSADAIRDDLALLAVNVAHDEPDLMGRNPKGFGLRQTRLITWIIRRRP